MENNNYNQRANSRAEDESRSNRNQLPVVEELAEADSPVLKAVEDVKIGMVTDCKKLNVRKNPSADADIICELLKLAEVMISDSESTDEFYKINTDSGIEGFCMKKYIAVNQ